MRGRSSRPRPWTNSSRTPRQQGSTSDMTDVRSHSNGQGEPFAAPRRAPAADKFMTALTEAVRENPIPAALIGMGMLWLFTGGSNTSLLGGDGRKSLFRAGEASEAIEETAGRAVSSVGRTAHAAAETTSDLAGNVRRAYDGVSETAAKT